MCDTPSHGSDHLWLIWKESIQNYRCYRADTAGGTDGRTDGVKPVYPPTTSLFVGITSDAMGRSRPCSALVQVMPWCQMAPSHYLNQCWLTITETVRNMPEWHWGCDEMNNISQRTFSNIFSSVKLFEFWLTFHWNLFLRVQLTIFQHWFR